MEKNDKLEELFHSKVYTKKEAFEKVLLTSNEDFWIRVCDALFSFGPGVYYFIKFKFLDTATLGEFLGMTFLFFATSVLIQFLSGRNTLFMLLFGARLGSRGKMCYFYEDPYAIEDLKGYTWKRVRTSEVFNVIDDVSGATQDEFISMGVVRMNNKRFKLFQKYYPTDK